MSVLYYRDSNGIFKPLPTIQGKSAYQGAVEGGYSGTEEEFNQMLANLHAGYIPTPSSASVGQTIRVSAVDENGKPTEWEAVDFPEGGGGGGEAWDYEKDITITADNAANSYVINQFDDGSELQLEKGIIYFCVRHDQSVSSCVFSRAKVAFSSGASPDWTQLSDTAYSNNGEYNSGWTYFYKQLGKMVYEISESNQTAYVNYVMNHIGGVRRIIQPILYNDPTDVEAKYVKEISVHTSQNIMLTDGVIKIRGVKYKG